jgi:non-ribosomal peptide synthetase component F
VTVNGDTVASLAQRVREHARARPEAGAVLTAGAEVTYGALDGEATYLAERLRDLGVRPGQTVAVLLPRSAEAIAALVAVSAVGATYVPLDPAYPDKSLRLMIESAGCAAVLTDSAHRDLPPAGTATLTVEPAFGSAARSVPAGDPAPPARVHPRDLAYVVFTSGSTGVPKGAAIEYRSVLNLVDWHVAAYSITAGDRCPWLAGPGFDASVWEIWPALYVGATLCLPRESDRLDAARLRDWLVERAVRVAFAPTPVAARLIRLPWPAATP